MKRFIFPYMVVTFSLVIVWGCVNLGEGTKLKTKFYVLQSTAGSQDTSMDALNKDVSIGVGPVQLPEYLARPQIVTRAGSSQLKIDEFFRWAEPLDEAFSRTLGENLAVLLSTNQIFVYPWKTSSPLTYQVTVDVKRFEGTVGKDVFLHAVWTVYDKDRKSLLLRQEGDYSQASEEGSYDALVSAHSRSLEALSRDIAAGIHETARKRKG